MVFHCGLSNLHAMVLMPDWDCLLLRNFRNVVEDKHEPGDFVCASIYYYFYIFVT